MVYSLAITITLGTPAPPCPSVLSRFSLCSFLLLVRVLPELSLFLSLSRPFALYMCMYVCVRIFLPFPWPPLIASSPCRPFTLPCSSPHGGSRSFCRVGHGYSAIVFELSCSCCGCCCCGERFTCLPLLRYFTGGMFPSLSLSFFLFSLSVFLSPFSSRFFVCLVSLVLTPSFSITRC